MMKRLLVLNLLSPAATERPVVFSMKPAKVTRSLKNFSHSSPRIEDAWAGAVIRKIINKLSRKDIIRLNLINRLLTRFLGLLFSPIFHHLPPGTVSSVWLFDEWSGLFRRCVKSRVSLNNIGAIDLHLLCVSLSDGPFTDITPKTS